MTRVATFAMHQSLFSAISRSQQKLAASQLQMTTGKRAVDFASLGIRSASTLSARSLVAAQEAHRQVTDRLSTTLSLYDAHLSGAEDAAAKLRTKILGTLGTGQSAGLQGAMEEAFQRFRTSLNADEAGVPLFAGTQTQASPFKPSSLAETAGLPASAAFTNDQVRATAEVAEGQEMEFGLTASSIGTDLFEAFRTLAEAGPIGDTPTAAQRSALEKAVGLIDGGLKTLRSPWSENGRRQAQVEAIAASTEERGLILQDLISRNEDADMAQVASDLARHKSALEASYTVFARLSGLSLVNYLR